MMMIRNSANFLVRFTFGSQAESNPDNDNHELSAFYVPDTVSVLLLILQFRNNKKYYTHKFLKLDYMLKFFKNHR